MRENEQLRYQLFSPQGCICPCIYGHTELQAGCGRSMHACLRLEQKLPNWKIGLMKQNENHSVCLMSAVVEPLSMQLRPLKQLTLHKLSLCLNQAVELENEDEPMCT